MQSQHYPYSGLEQENLNYLIKERICRRQKRRKKNMPLYSSTEPCLLHWNSNRAYIFSHYTWPPFNCPRLRASASALGMYGIPAQSQVSILIKCTCRWWHSLSKSLSRVVLREFLDKFNFHLQYDLSSGSDKTNYWTFDQVITRNELITSHICAIAS